MKYFAIILLALAVIALVGIKNELHLSNMTPEQVQQEKAHAELKAQVKEAMAQTTKDRMDRIRAAPWSEISKPEDFIEKLIATVSNAGWVLLFLALFGVVISIFVKAREGGRVR